MKLTCICSARGNLWGKVVISKSKPDHTQKLLLSHTLVNMKPLQTAGHSSVYSNEIFESALKSDLDCDSCPQLNVQQLECNVAKEMKKSI